MDYFRNKLPYITVYILFKWVFTQNCLIFCIFSQLFIPKFNNIIRVFDKISAYTGFYFYRCRWISACTTANSKLLIHLNTGSLGGSCNNPLIFSHFFTETSTKVSTRVLMQTSTFRRAASTIVVGNLFCSIKATSDLTRFNQPLSSSNEADFAK